MNIDQHGLNNQLSELLSGAEASELLGVKRSTLYAYASRGLLRSEPSDGGHERRYRRSDVERLRARTNARAGHGAVAASALRWGEPVLESALTAIRDGGLWYRGLSAIALAEADTPFEVIAEFLWDDQRTPRAMLRAGGEEARGSEQKPIASRRRGPRVLKVQDKSGAHNTSGFTPFETSGLGIRPSDLAALLPLGAPALPSLALTVAAVGAHDLERFYAPPQVEVARARSIVKRMAAALGLGEDPRRTPAALRAESVAEAILIALGVRRSATAVRAMNAALVLCADHELNASTFAVRVAASAGADLYACVSAGLATVSGPEHGGACDRVEALVAEAGRPERARAVVQERARRGEAIPGFGHKLYPHGDPRAPLLLRAAASLASGRVAVRTLLALAEAMRETGREPPSIDTGLVALTAALGAAPGSAAGIFAVGRSAGWIAHAIEQRRAGFMMRPRARYTGP